MREKVETSEASLHRQKSQSKLWRQGTMMRQSQLQRIMIGIVTLFGLMGSGAVYGNKGQVTKGETKTLSFAVVGDIMMSPRMLRGAFDWSCKCYKFGPMFSHIKPWIAKADVAIGNLETTFPGPKGGYTGFPFFGAPDELGRELKRVGFDVLITANNHIFDKKTAGLVRTLNVLDRMKFQHVGVYRSLKENKGKRFIVIQKNGIRIALLAYTSHVNSYHSLRTLKKYHVNYMRYKEIKRDLQAVRKHKFDMVVVYMHSWPEHKNFPHPYQKKRVGWFLKWGADMVLGSHPHVVQPITMLKVRDKFNVTKHRLVAWSLGNFVSSMSSFYSRGSIMLFFNLEKKRDAKGRWKTRVSKVSYQPIWTHREKVTRRVGKRRRKRKVWTFSVLPISTFRKNDQPTKLSRWSYRRMMRYNRFIQRHLKKGLRIIQRVLDSKQ